MVTAQIGFGFFQLKHTPSAGALNNIAKRNCGHAWVEMRGNHFLIGNIKIMTFSYLTLAHQAFS